MVGLKSAIKRGLFGPAGIRPREISRGLLKGLKFNVDSANKSMRLLGLDESEIASTCREMAAGARSALDVGANDGWYAIYFASLPNIDRVFAFEPDGAIVESMRRNLELNDPSLLAKTTLVQGFVGNRAAENGWVRLDDYAGHLPQPVLIKIDVDGGEIDVLEGARQLLSSRDCRLIVETHSPQLESGCIERLSAMGYACRVIDNAWYRKLIPENRQIPHNRWFVAKK